MKPFKIIYNIFAICLGIIALLLIFSAFPIIGNYKILVVQSGSMQPALKNGSLVVVKPSNDYKIGEVVTFCCNCRNKACLVSCPVSTTHRIYDIRVQEGVVIYITKGDANEAPDSREVYLKEIIGKVLFDVPYLGYAVDAAKKPVGFVLIIGLPAIVIIYDEVKKIRGEIMNHEL